MIKAVLKEVKDGTWWVAFYREIKIGQSTYMVHPMELIGPWTTKDWAEERTRERMKVWEELGYKTAFE